MRALIYRHVSRFAALACFATLAILAVRPAAASDPPAPAVDPSGAPAIPADVQKVLTQIGDLNLLKIIAPLQLTPDQIDKLLVPMHAIAAEGEAKRKMDYEALRALADDVAKARTEALTGAAVPDEVDRKVVKASGASEDRYNAAKKDAIARIFAVAKESLTPTQKDQVEAQVTQMLGGRRLIPREYRDRPSQAPKEAVRDLALSAFVERVLILDRTAVLLSEMKSAGSSRAAAAPETKKSGASDAAKAP
jgi:hypothetical protein